MVKDPVCGMEIEPQAAFATREHMGQKYYFCSEDCLKKFEADPHIYASHPSSSEKLAGSITTGYNPELDLAQVDLPIIGLRKDGQAGAKMIKNMVEKAPGVTSVIANPVEEIVAIRYDPKETQVIDLVKVVKTAGYRVGGAQKRIGIENLRCASCVKFIEKELETTPGVLNASVSLATQEATVEYLPEQTSLPALNTAIESWGIRPMPLPASSPPTSRRQPIKKNTAA